MKNSQIHRNRPLESISVAYKPEGLIASELAPMVPVKHESDEYFVYSKDNLRVPKTLRGNGALANQASWNVSTSTYNLAYHALRDIVTDRERRNADNPIQPDVDVTEQLTGQILLRREIDAASIVQTAANWANTTSLTSTLSWSQNTTLSNPITVVDSATTAIRRASGKKANVMAIDDSTFKAAKEHVSILDRIKYTSPDSVTPAMLAKLFGIGKLLVAGSVQNTGQEGLADTMSDIWTDTAFIGYVEPSPGLKKPSALYTMVQNGMSEPYVVTKYREEARKGDWVEVETAFQHKVVASDCGYLIVNTI